MRYFCLCDKENILFTLSPSQQPPWQLPKQASACSKCNLYCFGPYLCLCERARATFEWSDAEILLKNQQHAHCENCFSAQCTTNTAECALVCCTACKVKMHGCKMDDHWTFCTTKLRYEIWMDHKRFKK